MQLASGRPRFSYDRRQVGGLSKVVEVRYVMLPMEPRIAADEFIEPPSFCLGVVEPAKLQAQGHVQPAWCGIATQVHAMARPWALLGAGNHPIAHGVHVIVGNKLAKALGPDEVVFRTVGKYWTESAMAVVPIPRIPRVHRMEYFAQCTDAGKQGQMKVTAHEAESQKHPIYALGHLAQQREIGSSVPVTVN